MNNSNKDMTELPSNTKDFIEYRTVRFGLQSYKYQKDEPNFEDDSLEKLCDLSRTNIINIKKADQNLSFDELINRGVSFFADITDLENIIKILDNKYSSHFRLEKDFYRQICHIVNETYSTFKDEEGKKKQSANSQYILFEDTSDTVQNWVSNLQINLESNIYNCKNLLNEYKNLPDDAKINKVNVIKKLNEYFKNIIKTVTYIKYNNLNYENLSKNKDLEELHIEVFKNIDVLINRLEKINNDINQFSTTQEFGRGSFNLKTVLQKTNKTETEESKLKEIGYFKVFNNILNNEEYAKRYNFSVNKNLDENSFVFKPQDLRNGELKQLEKLFTYKPKKAKAIVTQHIADILSKDAEFKTKKDEINSILNWFGDVPKIGLDYKDFIEKGNNLDNFKLEFYPVKFAFDYAIEELAKDSYNPNNSFPRKSCKEYIKKYFSIDENTDDYKTFCSLHELKDKIRRLKREFNGLKTNLAIVDEAKIVIEKSKNNLSNELKAHITTLENWLKNYENNYEVLKIQYENRKNTKDYADELKSEMSAIGLYRGNLKTKMPCIKVKVKKDNIEKNVDKTISEVYKTIACDYGKTIAELRSILEEKENTDKIQYFTQIVTDENNKKYILAIKKENIAEQNNLFSNSVSNYCIKSILSITSKSIKKMLSNPDSYTKKSRDEDEQFFDLIEVSFIDKKTNRQKIVLKVDLQINKNDRNEMVNSLKEKKLIEKDSNVNFIRDSLLNSKMSKSQGWNSIFNWEKDLKEAKTFEELMQVVDNKGYAIINKKIDKEKIIELVETNKAYLFPIVNQDLGNNNKKGKNNRFTDELEKAISQKDNYRLHPEFTITYRLPPYDQNKIEEDKKTHRFNKHTRYHRLQLNGHFGIEIYPNDYKNTITRTEKNKILKDNNQYSALVSGFNEKVNKKLGDKPYYYGIDRGLNELATLCVMKSDEEIQDFIVFKKERVEDGKFYNNISANYQQKANQKGGVYRYKDATNNINSTKQSILDLTNLKVETWHWEKTLDSSFTSRHPNEKILIENLNKIKENEELSKIAVKQGLLIEYFSKTENKTEYKIPEDKITFIVKYPEDSTFVNRLKSLSYIRKLQFQLQDEGRRKKIINKIIEIKEENKNKELLEYLFKDNNILQWVDNGVEGTAFAGEKYEKIINDFKEFFEYVKKLKIENYNDKFELHGFENLKKGIVSNITGVLGYIFEKRKGYIVFEDLSSDKISNEIVIEKEQAKLQGLNMYRDIEVSVARYFQKLQYTPPLTKLQEMNKLHYKISHDGKGIFEYKQFGNIRFVSGSSTSKTCPNCYCASNSKNELEINSIHDYYNYDDNGFLIKLELEYNTLCKKTSKSTRQKNFDGSDYIICTNCGFCTDETKKERIPNKKTCNLRTEELNKVKNGDQNAGFIIALLGARKKYNVNNFKVDK